MSTAQQPFNLNPCALQRRGDITSNVRQKVMSQHPPILKGYHRNNILIAIVPVVIGVACGLWGYHRQESFAPKDNLQMALGYGFIFGVCAFVLAIIRMGFSVPMCPKCKCRCKRIRAIRITENGAWGIVSKSWWSVFRCTQCRSNYRVSGRY